MDPLFRKVGKAFVEEQTRLFGTDHLYAADTFIEMTPPSGDTNFLAATAKAIYRGMADSDPQAVWVLQGWTFFNQAKFWTQPRIEAFLDAVPNQHMLVLDLFCDVTPVWSRTHAFCGKPWVWCALQNFGDCVFLGLRGGGRELRFAPGGELADAGGESWSLDGDPVVLDLIERITVEADPGLVAGRRAGVARPVRVEERHAASPAGRSADAARTAAAVSVPGERSLERRNASEEAFAASVAGTRPAGSCGWPPVTSRIFTAFG